MEKYFYTLFTYARVGLRIFWVDNWYSHRFIRELERTLKIGRLPEAKRRRIRNYVVQGIVMSGWVTSLKGKRLKKVDIKRVFWLNVFTPLIDDFTDDLKMSSTEIIQKIKSNDLADHDEFRMIRCTYNKLIENQDQDFIDLFHRTLQSQDPSIKQLEEKQLGEEELIRITRDKGGLFTLFSWLVIRNSLVEGEFESIHTLGYVMQQINDAFDVYKDHQKGQQTLFTRSSDIKTNYDRYYDTIDEFVNQFVNLGYKKINTRLSLMEISAILGRGAVSIDQLRALQVSSGNEFKVDRFTRKELVCDMEKISNIVKSMLFTAKFYNQIKAAERRKITHNPK